MAPSFVAFAVVILFLAPVFPSAQGSDWASFSRDLRNSRAAYSETAFEGATALHVAWNVSMGGAVTGTPVVVNGIVYVGTWQGHLRALSASTGATVWDVNVGHPIDSTAAVSKGIVFVGDGAAILHALNATTGAFLWNATTDTAPQAHLWGSPAVAKGMVITGVASGQECTCYAGPYNFRGSVVAYNMTTGALVWKTYTTPVNTTGAAVWNVPMIDLATNALFVGTGNAYVAPASASTDAMISMNLTTGKIRWVHQFTAGDVWVPSNTAGPDADFGSTGNLFFLNGTRVVGEASKNGVYHVVLESTGATVWEAPKASGGSFLVPATAAAYGNVFESYAYGGVLQAIRQADGASVWKTQFFTPTWHPSISGHRLFVGDESGAVHLLNATTGASLWSQNLGAGKIQSGISIANHLAFVGTEGSGFGSTNGRLVALAPG